MKAYFSDLPLPLQEQLGKLSRSEDPGLTKFYRTEAGGGKVVGIIFGLLGLGVIAAMAVFSSVWELPVAFIAGGVASLFMMMVLFNVVRYRRYRRSTSRPGIVATPLVLGMVGLDHEVVWMFYHLEIVDHQITHHIRNGAYQYTAFTFKYKSGSLSFSLNSRKDADSLLEYLRSSPGLVQGWVQSGVAEEQVRAYDWISQSGEAAGRADAPHVPPGGVLLNSGWAKFGMSCAAGLLFGFAAFGVNLTLVEMKWWANATRENSPESYHSYAQWAPFKWHRKEAEIRWDDRSYEVAVQSGTAGSLRKYLSTFPAARHAAEARQGLVELYKRAEESYLARASKANPQASAGIRALLANLREKPTPAAYIKFVAGAPLDDAAIDASARKSTGSTRIRSMGPSFTPERNRERESRILAVMKASFRTVFSDDLFDLVGTPPGPDDARFLVAYRVASSGTVYTWNSEDGLPMAQREIFMGMEIRFTFTLQVPGSEHPVNEDPEKGYAFAVNVKPAPNFDVVGESAGQVYDRMASTAFDKFEIDLANAYGLERTMPESWGKLPGTSGGTRPGRTPAFKAPEIKLPPLLKKDVDSLILESLLLVPPSAKEPRVEQIEKQVRERAAIYKTALPDDEAFRAKIRLEISVWRLRNPVAPKVPGKKPEEKKPEEDQ